MISLEKQYKPENITKEFIDKIKLPDKQGKKLNYLMILPKIAMGDDNAYRMPYGFCMVSSALKASGRLVFTINLNYKSDPMNLIKQTILENNIDVVITGGLSGQFSTLREILEISKSTKPNISTLVGGGIITADPLVAMTALDFADFGMIGEGEYIINSLAFALEHDTDPTLEVGIISREGKMGPQNLGISNLNILPFPDYDGFEMDLLQRENLTHFRLNFSDNGIPIAIGRSCPYNCTFCFHSSGSTYRRRSFESIKNELDWATQKYPNVKLIQFFDEMFSADMDFLKQLTSYMVSKGLKYQMFHRVDSVSRELLQLLKDTGCQCVFFGVESADNRILKSMKKNITVKQIEEAFDLALDIGLKVRGNIIFGDPEETQETISNTLDWWIKHPQYSISTAWIFTFPGAHIYKRACERGIITNRVEYLKKGHMQLNLTKMTDEVYWDVVLNVSLYQMVSSNGMDVNFDDMDKLKDKIKVKLDVLSNKSNVAIWPAKFDTIAMLNQISPSFISSKNVTFVNIDPSSSYVSACETFGKKVYTPDEALLGGEIETVLYALGSRTVGQMIFNQISESIDKNYPSVKEIICINECI